MEAIGCSKILIFICWTVWHQIPKNSNLHSHCHRNFKSHLVRGGGNVFVGCKLIWNGGVHKMFPFDNKCMWSEISAVMHALILLAIKYVALWRYHLFTRKRSLFHMLTCLTCRHKNIFQTNIILQWPSAVTYLSFWIMREGIMPCYVYL
jgi:hypothetical protein